MEWKMGERRISVTVVSDAQEPEIVSSFILVEHHFGGNISTTNEEAGQKGTSLSCSGQND